MAVNVAVNEGNRSFRTEPIPATVPASIMRRISTMSDGQPVIVFALFPGMTQLDFTGPHEVFSSLPGASVILASAEGGAIEATGGMTFVGVRRLADITSCDVICVPGGRGATDNAIGDPQFLAELRRLAGGARYI